MRPHLSDAQRDAMVARVTARVGIAPPPAAPRPSGYTAPTYKARPANLENVREHNLSRMAAWVEETRSVAAKRVDPVAFLMEKHDWLGRLMSDLGDGCSKHLRGLTAFDIGEAQIALIRPLSHPMAKAA